ncbi:MAG: hypothetical protein H0T17_03005 [Propionibacteriales bacterium]|nr:hypothetical protein [Propionibacteriales bacterium]
MSVGTGSATWRDATTPDLKESHGGLRDGTLLRALAASWMVDVLAAELRRLSNALLDIRDTLHETTTAQRWQVG